MKTLEEAITPQARRIVARRLARDARMEAQGVARGLLAVLAARGVAVDDASRARIEACSDLERLDRWVARATTADRVEDVLDTP